MVIITMAIYRVCHELESMAQNKTCIDINQSSSSYSRTWIFIYIGFHYASMLFMYIMILILIHIVFGLQSISKFGGRSESQAGPHNPTIGRHIRPQLLDHHLYPELIKWALLCIKSVCSRLQIQSKLIVKRVPRNIKRLCNTHFFRYMMRA